MRNPILALAAALSPALTALPALADEPLWEAGIGVAALSLPHYRGSNQSSHWLLPVPYFVYRGEFLRSDREGTRAVLIDSDRVDLDLSLAASAPVSSRDDLTRQGMADLSPTIEFGPKLNLALARGPGWKFDLRVPVRAVATLQAPRRLIGWSAEPLLNLDLEWSGTHLGLQGGPLFGDKRLHRYYYDVGPGQVTGSRPAYSAAAGYAGWQATAGMSKRIGQFWLGAFLRYDTVAGAVFEDSPLVKSRSQLAYGLAVSWIFAASETRVATRP